MKGTGSERGLSHRGRNPRKELHMTIGTYVTNFGILGIIREIKADGSLVLENVRKGKWVADPAKCEPYEIPVLE